ncbi:DNA polymerase III subunit delta [Salinispira pacifica]|uniref:DNA polymerase III subunit delta n=1 Tax=Salinispira pacifica TaxID=1307761 RepID=V5WN59_9SPIO|nr:DNA polymerase III subunit delta [Salinispira pacifica]AHC16629.1 DNA polymerase III delta subunit [Salinispira pacifica]
MHPCYMYYGPEHGKRQGLVNNLKSALVKNYGDALDVHKYYAGEDTPEQIISDLDNGALFASHTLALIHNAESLSRKSDIQHFEKFLKSQNPDVTLVFVSEQSRLDSKLVKLAAAEAREICWELFDNQKEGWVIQYLRKQNAGIEDDALELFLSLVGTNTQEMQQELDKILLLFDSGEKPVISADVVESYIFHAKEESVYTLFDAYAARDFSRALEILSKLRGAKSHEETSILIRFSYLVRNLAGLQAISSERRLEPADFTGRRILGKRNQNLYRNLLSRLDEATVLSHIRSCNEFEMALREQKSNLHHHLIQLWLYSLFHPVKNFFRSPRAKGMFGVDHQRFP